MRIHSFHFALSSLFALDSLQCFGILVFHLPFMDLLVLKDG